MRQYEQYDQYYQYNQEQQVQQVQQSQAPYNMPPVPDVNPTFLRDIILSIVQILFVPCFYGLIPLILTITANSSWKCGNYESYTKKTKAAKICLTIGWVILGIEAVVVIGGFIYLFFSMVTSGF